MNEDIPRRGLMLVLSSPSGAGKTTLSRRLLDSDGNIKLSVSATTRPMRPGEVHGVDYHFVAPEEFEAPTVLQRLGCLPADLPESSLAFKGEKSASCV